MSSSLSDRMQGVLGRLRASVRGGAAGSSPEKVTSGLAPISESVLEWCQAHPGTEVIRILPAKRVVKQMPRTIEPEVHAKFISAPEYVIPEKYLARLPGARLVGNVGLVVLPDGSFAAEAIYGRAHLELSAAYRAPVPARWIDKAGNYYSLLIEYGLDGNYYHWLHDVVLRLYRIVDHLPADTLFIVPPGMRPFQYETLAIAGIPPERLLFYDGTQAWHLENLYFSPPTVVSGADSAEADAWLRELVWRTYGISLAEPRHRIYVSRRNARHRRIVNEPEVQAYLAGLGFETHELERYSLRDQVALFAEAQIVISGHGAGLTNILFASTGLTVIDIFEPGELNKCYWNMCEALGHRYWYIFGHAVLNDSGYAADIRLPLAKLATTLDLAVSPRHLNR